MSNEEFVWVNNSKMDRLKKLAADKTIAILPPPPQDFLDAESMAREQLFHESLKSLEVEEKIHVLKILARTLTMIRAATLRRPRLRNL